MSKPKVLGAIDSLDQAGFYDKSVNLGDIRTAPTCLDNVLLNGIYTFIGGETSPTDTTGNYKWSLRVYSSEDCSSSEHIAERINFSVIRIKYVRNYTSSTGWTAWISDTIKCDTELIKDSTNPVEGGVIKAAIDNVLSAKGITSGDGFTYILENQDFELVDGATIRFQLHVDSSSNPTLNVNNTGAKLIKSSPTENLKSGNKAGTWFTAVYSSTLDCYLLQGSAAYHEHNTDDINYNDSSLTSTLDAQNGKLELLMNDAGGQTSAISINTESMDNWVLTEGYWSGTYISTGA